jgi:tRNA(fMet)-specific endonuclease VapC
LILPKGEVPIQRLILYTRVGKDGILDLETPIDDIVVCSIGKADFVHGAMKIANPPMALANQQPFISQFASLPFNDAAAEQYGLLRASSEKQGTLIGPNDLLIASIALANNVTLVAHNTDVFKRIPSLQMEDWQV